MLTHLLRRYASEQCAQFSSYVPNIDKAGVGVQVKYSSDRPWQSCAIFCKVRLVSLNRLEG